MYYHQRNLQAFTFKEIERYRRKMLKRKWSQNRWMIDECLLKLFSADRQYYLFYNVVICWKYNYGKIKLNFYQVCKLSQKEIMAETIEGFW